MATPEAARTTLGDGESHGTRSSYDSLDAELDQSMYAEMARAAKQRQREAKRLKAEKARGLALVRENPTELRRLPRELRGDEEVSFAPALACLYLFSLSLPPSLTVTFYQLPLISRSHILLSPGGWRQVVLAAVSRLGAALKFAREEVRAVEALQMCVCVGGGLPAPPFYRA